MDVVPITVFKKIRMLLDNSCLKTYTFERKNAKKPIIFHKIVTYDKELHFFIVYWTSHPSLQPNNRPIRIVPNIWHFQTYMKWWWYTFKPMVHEMMIHFQTYTKWWYTFKPMVHEMMIHFQTYMKWWYNFKRRKYSLSRLVANPAHRNNLLKMFLSTSVKWRINLNFWNTIICTFLEFCQRLYLSKAFDSIWLLEFEI